ncbi:protein prenylyltransferase [Jaminaea rosea]|uniref:Protein prenylyltransferase n=1 Tax=Jaminaea rosea TaxID=1569628 RepID=A0A316V0E8_9BASI|nr:protein prenylyltransferase [Jaminaea rosea]PWN31027.1 protein prenylyltransferase [Jaminaea rosea]
MLTAPLRFPSSLPFPSLPPMASLRPDTPESASASLPLPRRTRNRTSSLLAPPPQRYGATLIASRSDTSAGPSSPISSTSVSSRPPPRRLRRTRSQSSWSSILLPRRVQQQKAELYAKELDKARLRGHWSSDNLHFAGKAKNNTWAELLRKYSKHNPNQSVTPAVSGAEQEIRSSLAAFYAEEGYTDSSHEHDDAAPGSGKTAFAPLLPLNRQGQGWSGPKFEQSTLQLEDLAQRAGSHDAALQGITAIQAYSLVSLGKDEEAVSLLHESRFLQTVNTEQLRPEEQGEQYQTALFLLGFVTYGLANERLHLQRPTAGYSPFAFAGYARAIELHEEVRGGKRASALPGLPEDEIERWAETALYRNALFSVREGDASLGLNALRAYQAHVARWPADFRLPQRTTISRVYLRTLNRAVEAGNYVPLPSPPAKSTDDWRSQAYQRSVVAGVASRLKIRDFEVERAPKFGSVKRPIGIDAKGITSRTVSQRRPHAHRSLRPASISWSNEVQTIAHAAAATVQRSSEFPRAGKVNVSALLLSDELVRSWQLNGELGGEHADDVIDGLYTLARLTFHSQRISRHLFTLLTAAQAYDEAREALQLYVSIVEKAREGDAAGSAALVEESKLREKKQEEEGYDLEEIKQKEKEEEEKPEEEKKKKRAAAGKGGISKKAKETGEEVLLDADDDQTFIATLLHGAHVLAKYLGDAEGADKMARKAFALVPYQKLTTGSQTQRELVARALRVSGQARAALAVRQPSAAKLPVLQNEALAMLKEAVDLDPHSSEAHYQLARLLGQMREVNPAIVEVRKAIELEPADVQAWHLLVLLVSAQKDHKAAFKLAEVALDEAEDDDEADAQATNPNPLSTPNGRDSSKPVARTVLLSVDYPPSATERAEAILSLMMTQNALEEIVAGAEVALESQKETFEFFHRTLSQHVPPTASRGAAPLLPGKTALPADHVNSTGLGLSGSAANRPAAMQRTKSGNLLATNGSSNGVPAVMPPSTNTGGGVLSSAEPRTASPADMRRLYQAKREVTTLCSLWLMSAASFRRAGKIDEARAAVQEAEKVSPGRSDVWVQLALLSEESGDRRLAVNSLYKALACEAESVAAAVHLARIFLTHEDALLAAQEVQKVNAAGTGLPHPQHQTPLDDGTRSRSIGADAQPKGISVGGKQNAFKSSADAQSSQSARDLTALSLAEGLLVATTTSGSGWDCAEAWLFLGQVQMKTGRRQRAGESLRFAYELEKSKSVRGMEGAVPI